MKPDTPVFETLERRIQSAVFDQEFFIGCLLNGARDSLAVLRAENERAENQQVQSALQQFETFLFLG